MINSKYLFSLSILFFLSCNQLTPAQKSESVDERSGIPIYVTVDDETFPDYWKTDEINAKGQDLERSKVKHSISLLKEELKKYPVEVLKANLKRVYFLKSIEFYNVEFGGTNSYDRLYFTNNGESDGYTDQYLVQTIHHEFSSIFLRNFPDYFLQDEWEKNNKIPYGDGGVAALKSSQSSLEFDSTYNANGFLYQYANSDVENDLNSFAENIFAPSPEFYDLVDKYPALKNKWKLIIKFYNSIDPKFTEDYFLEFVQSKR